MFSVQDRQPETILSWHDRRRRNGNSSLLNHSLIHMSTRNWNTKGIPLHPILAVISWWLITRRAEQPHPLTMTELLNNSKHIKTSITPRDEEDRLQGQSYLHSISSKWINRHKQSPLFLLLLCRLLNGFLLSSCGPSFSSPNYLNRCRESAGILGGSDNQRIHMRLT